MSTFGGLMVEYPQIAIDRFQGDAVLRARGYFLSHCHSDHMVGLSSKKFADRLKCNPHIRLFCSEVTYEFLLTDDKYKHLQASLSSLPIEQTSTVTLVNEFNGKEEKLLVTLLPAGHCPGSVMFLFEGDQGTVLYTGDFRLAKGEAARMEPLHSGSRVKDIVSVYLDTTFCVPEAMYIPSREESKDALLDLVDRHISKSAGHMVKLNCKAKYGYEYLFVELSKVFNQQIHVSDAVMKQYDRVPDLRYHLTTEGSQTQIHACRYGACSLKNATDILSIQPSTMWFTGNARPEDVVRKVGRRYRLCFSFHSSFSEIRDFLGYIKPLHVYPNVIPYSSSEEEVIKRLQDCLRNSKTSATHGGNISMTTDFQPFGSLKNIRKVNRKRQHDHREDDFHQLFDSSPEKQKKKVESSEGRVKQAKDSKVSDISSKRADRGSEGREEEVDRGDGDSRTSDELTWELGNRTEERSYSCTFADSDGVLSDSDESDFDEGGENHGNGIQSPKGGQMQKKTEWKAGHERTHLKIKDNDDRTRGDGSYGSDDDNQLEEGVKRGREEEGEFFHGTDLEDSQSINPSQSSINDGSMALFSDDSHQGDSQRSCSSGLSSNNWLQYLPNQQTPTKIPPSQERKDNDDEPVIEEGDVAHEDSGHGHDSNPSSPILISDDDDDDDDDDVAESDSDVTHICSQRSVRSERSSTSDIEVISVTPREPSHSPGWLSKTREHAICDVTSKRPAKDKPCREDVSSHNRSTLLVQPNSVAKDKIANLRNDGWKQESVTENVSSLESVIEITGSP